MTTVGFNYQREHLLQVPWLLEKAFKTLPDVTVLDDNDPEMPDIMINSMPWKGIKRGKKTVYWELDIAEANHGDNYSHFDIVYFPSTIHQTMWPEQSKLLFMACDPEFYHPFQVDNQYDVLFVGRSDRSLRLEYLDGLKQKFSRVDITTEERGHKTSRLLSSAYCSYQLSEFENLEQRNFEYTGVVPMVLERVYDLPAVFTEEEHFLGFNRDNYEEFEYQIGRCIDDRDAALKMRDRAIKHIKKEHTYINRAKQILEDCL